MTISLTPDEVLEKLSCYHERSVERGTDSRNTNALLKMMKGDYAGKRYACVYTTSLSEKLAFFYNKRHVYNDLGRIKDNTSCHVICQDDEVEVGIKDIWELFSDLSEQDSSLVACIAISFYHLLYKTYHKDLNICLELDNWIAGSNEKVNADWSMPIFPKDVLNALNKHIGTIKSSGGGVISFEAFIYYWELCFVLDEYSPFRQIVRYRDDTRVPMRVQICTLAIRIAEYFMGSISYGTLLDLTANNKMGISFLLDELPAATKGAVHFAGNDLIKVLKGEGIAYEKMYVLEIDNKRYRTLFAIPSKCIYVFSENISKIEVHNWFGNRCFFLSKVKDRASFEEMVSRILMLAKEG